MSQLFSNERCENCGKDTLTIDSGLNYHSEYCSNCNYTNFEDYDETSTPEFKVGGLVVFKESVVKKNDYECPLFKIEDIINKSEVKVKELSSELSRHTKNFTLAMSDLNPVRITPLTLFRNYVINNSIIDGTWEVLSGEDVCAIKILRTIDYRSRNIEEFMTNIEDVIPKFFESKDLLVDVNSLGSSKILFDEELENPLFNQARNMYAEKATYLNSLDAEGLIEEYLSGGTAYRFTDYSIENNNYSRSMIQDAFDSKILINKNEAMNL